MVDHVILTDEIRKAIAAATRRRGQKAEIARKIGVRRGTPGRYIKGSIESIPNHRFRILYPKIREHLTEATREKFDQQFRETRVAQGIISNLREDPAEYNVTGDRRARALAEIFQQLDPDDQFEIEQKIREAARKQQKFNTE